MFLINKGNNEAISVERKSFKDLGFGERRHLQEWIAKNPAMLGEDLLIIQKEFADFDDTNERLDLLALDKSGDLVIVENKLDDSGKDVTWQALKYVSYCSGLTKNDIVQIYQKYLGTGKTAEDEICSFLEQDDFSEIALNHGDQRIIFIAAKFRKEVTSTVMWLLDHNIKIKCIKVTPYLHEDNIFIDTEQIIPVKDAEDYLIRLTNKKQQELLTTENNQTRHTVRIKFWDKLLSKMNEKSDLFKNISPSRRDNWIGCGSGVSNIPYNFVVTGNYARVELWINKGSQDYNKQIFDNLYQRKEKLQSKFGADFEWERLDNGKGSRISHYLRGVSVFNESDWDIMIDFLVDSMIRLEATMRDELKSAVPK